MSHKLDSLGGRIDLLDGVGSAQNTDGQGKNKNSSEKMNNRGIRLVNHYIENSKIWGLMIQI